MLKNKPNATISTLSLALILVLAIDSFTTTTAIWPFKTYVTVQIRNWMASKANLQVQCKDRHHHDLGVKQLSYLELFNFKFQLPFMLVAQYTCNFTWNGESHLFDVYVQLRDAEVCEKFCDWIVVESGPCLHNPDNDIYNKCYHWNPKSLIDIPVASYSLSELVNQTNQP
ncbi:hypothetical protein V2J09_014704 [Rumex salicifolius]